MVGPFGATAKAVNDNNILAKAINNNLFSLMLMTAFLKPVKLDATGEFNVIVVGLESGKGKLFIKVFNSPDGFPREDKKSIQNIFILH